MKRKWFVTSVVTLATTAAVVIAVANRPTVGGAAEPAKSSKVDPVAKTEQPTTTEPTARATQLPIGQVVLFSSGVGYFQREGSIEGNARIDLTFPVEDINDLLKSMVLQDL